MNIMTITGFKDKSPEVPFHGITLQEEKQDQEKISAEQK